jgi:hypothetical protein
MRGGKTGWLAALAALVLVLVSTACEPKQMQLDLGIKPGSTYEVLTHKVTIPVSLGCTRKALVMLTAFSFYAVTPPGTQSLRTVDGNYSYIVVDCPGPATTFTTVWRSAEALSKPAYVKVRAETVSRTTPLDPIDFDTAESSGAKLTHILCWPTPTNCAPA